MNEFQLESDVTVNPDCVAPIRGEAGNVVLVPVFVLCSQRYVAAGMLHT